MPRRNNPDSRNQRKERTRRKQEPRNYRSVQQGVRRRKKQQRKQFASPNAKASFTNQSMLPILLYTSLLSAALASGADSNTEIKFVDALVFDENGVVKIEKPELMNIVNRPLPPHAVAGEKIKMTYQGVDFYITVPKDAIPGQIIQIKIPIRKCIQSETAEYVSGLYDPYGETPCDQRISDASAFFITRGFLVACVLGGAAALEAVVGAGTPLAEGMAIEASSGAIVAQGSELALPPNTASSILTSGGALSAPALDKAARDVEKTLKDMFPHQEPTVKNPQKVGVVNTKAGSVSVGKQPKSVLSRKLAHTSKHSGKTPNVQVPDWDKFKDIDIDKASVETSVSTLQDYGMRKGPPEFKAAMDKAKQNAQFNEGIVGNTAPPNTYDWASHREAVLKVPKTVGHNRRSVSFSNTDNNAFIPYETDLFVRKRAEDGLAGVQEFRKDNLGEGLFEQSGAWSESRPRPIYHPDKTLGPRSDPDFGFGFGKAPSRYKNQRLFKQQDYPWDHLDGEDITRYTAPNFKISKL